MATANTARRVLDAIMSAPHSISKAQIVANAEMTTVDLDLIQGLIDAGYLKEDRNHPGQYFTRKPKRDILRGFVAGANALPGITFEAVPERAPELTREQKIFSLLQRIRTATHSLELPDSDELNDLLDAGLINEHRDQPSHYFTRKPYRYGIDAFLNGNFTLEELFNATVTCDHVGDHTDHDDSPVCADGRFSEGVSITASMDAFLDQLEAIREQLNALLDANGR